MKTSAPYIVVTPTSTAKIDSFTCGPRKASIDSIKVSHHSGNISTKEILITLAEKKLGFTLVKNHDLPGYFELAKPCSTGGQNLFGRVHIEFFNC